MNNLTKYILAGLMVASLIGRPALAAVTPNSQVTPQTPKLGIVQFLQGTDAAGTYKTLYTGGTNGSICKAIVATTNDASASHLVTVQLVNTAVKYGGTAVNVPGNSGFATLIPPVALMSAGNWPGLPSDGSGTQYIYLSGSGDTIQATFATALTASAVLNLIAVCADY